MTTSSEFTDYYDFLRLPPTATRQEISQRIREMYLQWHPDVCRDPQSHAMSLRIGEAKEFLLDEAKRREYDHFRTSYYARRTQTSNANEWPYEEQWKHEARQARHSAEAAAQMNLEDLLTGILGVAVMTGAVAVGAAAVGAEYAWKGTERFQGVDSRLDFGKLFWCGVGGWACVICLAVPGVSIITFFCFRFAFFPAPEYKFIGLGNVLAGMIYSGIILILLFGCLLGLINSYT
jgi:hypothetical protein